MQFRDPLYFLILIVFPLVYWLSAKRQKIFMPFSNLDARSVPKTSLKLLLYRFLPILRFFVLLLRAGFNAA